MPSEKLFLCRSLSELVTNKRNRIYLGEEATQYQAQIGGNVPAGVSGSIDLYSTMITPILSSSYIVLRFAVRGFTSNLWNPITGTTRTVIGRMSVIRIVGGVVTRLKTDTVQHILSSGGRGFSLFLNTGEDEEPVEIIDMPNTTQEITYAIRFEIDSVDGRITIQVQNTSYLELRELIQITN